MNKLYFFIFILLAALPYLVAAHSLFLFNISLDFDKDLKSNTIKSAQEFAKINPEPLGFDLDKGLIIVHFEPDQRNYVEINPLGYFVQGMHNENLKHSSIENKLTKEQGLAIAKKFFENLPQKIKSELKYDNDISEVDGTYFYKWFRYVNGIIVAGEDLMVSVDAVNSNVIAWRLAIFDYPAESIDATPAIPGNVAVKVAELTFKNSVVRDFKPYIIISQNEPVWVAKLQGLYYSYFVGVNAKDGSIAFNGLLPGEIPKNYNEGPNLKVIETDFIKKIYNKY